MSKAMWSNEKYRKKAMHQFPEIVKMYLESIDVHVVTARASQTMGYQNGIVFHFECRTDKEDYKYFDGMGANVISEDHYPKMNPEVIAAPLGVISIADFSCFVKETIVTFIMEVPIASIDDIDRFMYVLKDKTQPIQYRKFSESIDKEVEQELGE